MKNKNKVWFFLHFFASASIIGYVLYVIKKFMKKIFIQIRQRILKHRKKLIYGALAFFIGQICFFGLDGLWLENEAFAADNTQSNQFESVIKKKTNYADFIYKFVYVLIYPVIFVAAKLVDNSFVYWEIFWFDAVLRELRNIIKNMANFTLWFIFVYKIFAYLISNYKGGNSKERPKQIITKALIAWIGIQASRFIMGVLIDISTVLIYGIWWLPISILSNTTEEKEPTSVVSQDYDPHVLKTVVSLDVSDLDNLNTYLTNIGTDPWNFYISECDTISFQHEKGAKQTLLLAPKMIYYKDGKGEYHHTIQTACSYYGKVYRFSNLYQEIEWQWWCSWSWCKAAQMKYNDSKTKARSKLESIKKDEMKSFVDKGEILEIWNAHIEDWIIWWINVGARVYWKDEKIWIDIDNERAEENNTKKLSEVLQDEEKTNSYVWVFTLLYASLLQEWQWLATDGEVSTYVKYLNMLLKVAHILAILIPLAAAAVVFMMRIGIIWMAVVLSPFIALFSAFKELWEKVFKWFLDYFSLKNLIPIIFAPAVICFAISMSTVLVTIIEKINTQHIDTNEEWILWWLIKLDIAWLSIWVWKLIIAVIWVAITRFLVRAAVQWTKLWKSGLVKYMKDWGEAKLWSAQIVPIPTQEGTRLISANKAFWLWQNKNNSLLRDIKDSIFKEYRDVDDKVVNRLIGNWWKSGEKWGDAAQDLYSRYNNHLFNDPTAINGDWTTHEFDIWNNQKIKFQDLSVNYQKQIIEDINGIWDANTRKRYGTGASSTVTVGTGADKTVYEFDPNESKYQVKSS